MCNLISEVSVLLLVAVYHHNTDTHITYDTGEGVGYGALAVLVLVLLEF